MIFLSLFFPAFQLWSSKDVEFFFFFFGEGVGVVAAVSNKKRFCVALGGPCSVVSSTWLALEMEGWGS